MIERYIFSNRLKTDITVTSPGRINIIGEHTDYNNGYVLPGAIDKTITFKLGKNNTEKCCRIYSKGFGDILEFDLDSITKKPEGWENYVLGVIHEILQRTHKLKGFDCTIESHLPVGSGVSSSAALECGLAFGLNTLFELGLTKWEIIELSQTAEHEFVGTKCGIMDQFASVMGKKDHVMFLDCMTLDFEYIPMDIEPYRILLLNTNVAHNLASSAYNIRRSQCEKGLAVLRKNFGKDITFRNVTTTMLHQCKEELGETIFNRCSYVIEENLRVFKAVTALKEKNLIKFGQLLYQTHEGLRHKYEVSCPELDFLVDFAKDKTDVLGARMMGGGFGGCTLNIVHEEAIDDFIKEAGSVYHERFSNTLTFFQTVPSQGTTISSENVR
ncbi:galactokinase [Allomuricauda ruestringensis DSM 13258]|uniref:Galactokinase n=1 Tax=Allomuricauda ruestringensis (strain DSM 13258 / CIP 107369 / LMG 19739 / B1) TaxID=886377 RepID=G2PS25_ALLRU|nr:galactokinase [Allomuricauda ruestringensis]AEM69615.1 galactokinase [Allomuricauda ruestringensis DSM 13258]